MRTKNLGILIFIATIILITIPLLMLTSAGSSDNFSASVSIGNLAPTINIVYNGTGSDSPAEGTTKVIYFQFNATDDNGVADLNISAAFMNMTRTGETTRTSSACTSAANFSNTEKFNCSITIYYYDGQGIWNLCAYIRDNTGSGVSNCTMANFSMGATDSIDVVNASISLTGNASQQDVGPAHVVINNTGNQNYTNVRINATYLNNGSDIIGVGNFSVNVTNNASGEALTENAYLTISSSNLSKGASATRDLYFYLDIPAVPSLNYNSNRSWVIDPS
jgi:hypothetical protein